MVTMLAQLQLIAHLVFSNGTEVKLAASQPRGVVAVSIVKAGLLPNVTQVLTRLEALGWAYAADRMGQNDSTHVAARMKLPIVKHTVDCGQVDTTATKGCKGSLINVAIFGKDYAYLRPGPFPRDSMKVLAQLLRFASGEQPNIARAIPFVWVQP